MAALFDAATAIRFNDGWVDARGEARGVAIGEVRGEAKGVREAIETLCDVFAIDLTPERRAELDAASLPALRERLSRIKRERSW